MCGPSSCKLETKNTSCFLSCFLQVLCAAQSVSCSKQIQTSTMHTLRWLRLHLFLALYFMMVFIGENTCGGHLVAS